MHFFLMSQGSLNRKIRFLCQKVCSVARVQTDTQTDTKVYTEDTLSGFQEFFLQPIIKDRPNYSACVLSVYRKYVHHFCFPQCPRLPRQRPRAVRLPSQERQSLLHHVHPGSGSHRPPHVCRLHAVHHPHGGPQLSAPPRRPL